MSKKTNKKSNVTEFVTRQECAESIQVISEEVTGLLVNSILTSNQKDFRGLFLPQGPFQLLIKALEYAQEVFHEQNPCGCETKGKHK